MLGHKRGRNASAKLKRKRFSPSLFVVHFSTRGEWPDVPHHSILFGPRYAGLLRDIYRGTSLAQDPSLYLHHPTATDRAMAPEGKSTFYALAPVPHLARAPIDWEAEGPRYRDRILAPGGSRDAADLVEDFLGRPYTFDAYADWLAR